MIRRLSLLSLVAVCAACSSDSDKPVSPDRLRLQIVSGDRQTAQVRLASGAQAVARASGASFAALPANLLPEPLVARITVDGEPMRATARSSDPLAPSFATLPSDVVVTYRVIEPADRGQRTCGASFVDAAKPDADGMVTTYWERGTYAGTCTMEVRLVVDGMPRVDTAFVVEFEPGRPIYMGELNYVAIAGAPLDLRAPANGIHAEDEFGNRIHTALLVERWTPTWEITGPKASRYANCDNLAVAASGTGWTVPSFPAYSEAGYCLWVSFEGRVAGGWYVWPAQAGGA